jgi:hypothetical protein
MKKSIVLIGKVAVVFLLVFFTSCSVNRAKVDNSLGKYFEENKVEGCFTILNNSDGKVTVYNMSLDTARFSPASTFKIVNALIGLEIGKKMFLILLLLIQILTSKQLLIMQNQKM